MENKRQIIIFKSDDGSLTIDVKLEDETIWLHQQQMAELFSQTKQNISLHVKNIFSEMELVSKSVVKESLTTAKDGKSYLVNYYNLDVIISVGYRVKSKRGTQFRIWANSVLKDYLVKGYALREKRLNEKLENLRELEKAVLLIQKTAASDELRLDEAKGLLNVISDYTRSLIILSKYDSQTLEPGTVSKKITYEIKFTDACKAIDKLRETLMTKKEATKLFGNQKDNSLEGILGNIVQTFGGEYLYPSIEEQAAHLLYFIIKNHPFSDGNKRIGAFMFVWFLQKNKHLVTKNGKVKINDNALVALALLVAQSNPDEKELMVTLIINLINKQ